MINPKFCIAHTDGSKWTLSMWHPKGGWWGEWRLLNHFDSEADAQMCMKRLAAPVTTRKYYDKHGYDAYPIAVSRHKR